MKFVTYVLNSPVLRPLTLALLERLRPHAVAALRRLLIALKEKVD
jgi:hypothetical protein